MTVSAGNYPGGQIKARWIQGPRVRWAGGQVALAGGGGVRWRKRQWEAGRCGRRASVAPELALEGTRWGLDRLGGRGRLRDWPTARIGAR